MKEYAIRDFVNQFAPRHAEYVNANKTQSAAIKAAEPSRIGMPVEPAVKLTLSIEAVNMMQAASNAVNKP